MKMDQQQQRAKSREIGKKGQAGQDEEEEVKKERGKDKKHRSLSRGKTKAS